MTCVPLLLGAAAAVRFLMRALVAAGSFRAINHSPAPWNSAATPTTTLYEPFFRGSAAPGR